MRIAVTGGSGFVGSHATRTLLAGGDDVVVIARRPNAAPDHLPDDLEPITPFSAEAIRGGLPPPERFRRRDFRLFNRTA